jgi:crotonobetainyl-CoA:carnitine CoA-transferase CaiB-like acyl-CoA transferase
MKLEGVRVLDLSMFLPGPHLTMMMADHGADVIKVEPPTGDPPRELGYRTKDGVSTWFRNTNRGKRSVVLDLKSEAGKAALFRLIETADVFVEAFRPGVVERLGVGPGQAREINPRLVYVSIAAFGQTGPWASKPAHDPAIQSLAGTSSLNLGSDGAPTMMGIAAADAVSSLMSLSAILMALLRRERTGRGDFVDMSMHDALMAWTPNVTGPVFAEDRAPNPKHERTTGGSAFLNYYATKDGKWVCLGGVEHKFVHNLLEALGRPDLIEAAAGPPGPPQDPVKAFLSETFLTRTRAEWVEWFEGRDVCFAPVLDLREAFDSEQARAREMRVEDADGNLHIGVPMKFAEEPGRVDSALPGLGEHTEAVLREAGLSEAVVAECVKAVPR